MPGSVRKSLSNVVTLVWMSGKCFALERAGRKVQVRPIKRRHREPPVPGTGVVLPFPARVR